MATTEQVSDKGHRGVYFVKDEDGVRRKKTTPTVRSKKAALQAARDREAEVRSGTWFDPAAGRGTFADYFEHQWLPNRGVELNTRRNYRSQFNAKKHGLKVTWGDWQLRRITNSDVQGWVTRMVRDGLSPATIEARFVTFQTVLAAKKGASAMRDRLIQYNPCQGVQIPQRTLKRVQFYEPDQVWDLCDELGEWWASVALLASETGMRWGELMGLQVRDFTLNYQAVRVERVMLELTLAETGNGTPFAIKDYPKEGPYGDGEPKTVSLTGDAQELVAGVIARRGLGREDFLFSMPNKQGTEEILPKLPKGKQPNQVPEEEWTVARTSVWPGGYPISRNYYREQIWKPAIARAGVPVLKFHALRASHITWLLHSNLDLTTVMDRVGHRLFTTTKRYAGVMDEADRRAVDALDSMKSRYRDRGARRTRTS
jgi:integrase